MIPRYSFMGAMLRSRCPKCREGRVFHPLLRKPKEMVKMKENCECCGMQYEIEPGFFWGSMFFTYGVNVAVVITGLLLYLLLFPSVAEWIAIGIIGIASLLVAPLNFRLSRMMMLYLFSGVQYDAGISLAVRKGKRN